MWTNEPSILVGRNQNTYREIDEDFARANDIKIVRRLSGGGTIFTDPKTLQFTFIGKKDQASLRSSFEKFARPIVAALKDLGLDAEFKGRNDILIGDKKICGNAQYTRGAKVLHHGSILFECDPDFIARALRASDLKFKDKAVKSVSSRIGYIKDYLQVDMDVQAFKDYLISYVKDYYGIDQAYILTAEDMAEIRHIADSKFRTKEWIYGRNPISQLSKQIKVDSCGLIEFNLSLVDNIISDISLRGCFFSEDDIEHLENSLRGREYRKEAILEFLKTIDLNKYIRGLSKEEFLAGLFN